MYVYAYAYAHVYVWVWVCACVSVSVCVYVYVHIYIYTISPFFPCQVHGFLGVNHFFFFGKSPPTKKPAQVESKAA